MKKSILKAAILLLLVLSSLEPTQAVYENVNSETETLLAKAHKNDASAMEQLGDIYAQGTGVQQDKDEAMIWYALASQLGNEKANNKLWKLEGHAERKVKQVKKSHKYNTKATHDLCAYLYLTADKANSLLPPEAIPDGVKSTPASNGKVTIEPYNPATVRKLLKKGADPRVSIPVEDINRPLGATGLSISPFAMVARQDDLKTLDLFITHGCCINQHGNALVQRAFRLLERDDAKTAKKLLKYLTERGLNLNMRSNWSSTRLIDCACVDDAKGVAYLAKQGLSPDAELESRYLLVERIRRQSTGDRALGMAVRNIQIYTIDALIKAKADLNYIWKGKTVLDSAIAQQGDQPQSTKTYKEEFKRLESLIYGNRKSPKGSSLHYRDMPKKNGISVVHLLRLAGAKTAAELNQGEPAAP